MPAVTFADVLDRLVDGGATRSSSTVHRAAGIFTFPLAGAPLSRPRARFPFTAPPPPRRPTRRLTPGQREALDLLRRTGNPDLPEDFTTAELKTAFRRAARRVHPDRHPDPAAHEALALEFCRVRQAYEILMKA
ncbi:MAG TPA: DnaJ domain-containing protein [Vicinamibacterales bacterium]